MDNTKPISGKVRFLRITKAAAVQLRRMVLDALESKPHSSAEIVAATGATRGAIAHQLYWLADLGHVQCTGSGPKAIWSVTEHYLQHKRTQAAAKQPTAAAPRPFVAPEGLPIVRVYADPAWTLPAAQVTMIDGVRTTRQAAPAPRFAVRIEPGTGVISQDNPRLAKLAKAAPRRVAA